MTQCLHVIPTHKVFKFTWIKTCLRRCGLQMNYVLNPLVLFCHKLCFDAQFSFLTGIMPNAYSSTNFNFHLHASAHGIYWSKWLETKDKWKTVIFTKPQKLRTTDYATVCLFVTSLSVFHTIVNYSSQCQLFFIPVFWFKVPLWHKLPNKCWQILQHNISHTHAFKECLNLCSTPPNAHQWNMFIIYYLLRTCFCHFCNNHQGTFTTILIKYNKLQYYTGRFIIFSVITNIYNKKTKGPTLMEFFTAPVKPKKVFFFFFGN